MTGPFIVSVLYARSDSHYKEYPWADVWDAERDARRFGGGLPVVAHPPCRAWGRLRKFAKPRPGEKALALHAVEQVRKYGGVLEHPAWSTLWDEAGLPYPGNPVDAWGGYCVEVDQVHWGHVARKRTWIYVVGAYTLPKLPAQPREATKAIRPNTGSGEVCATKREREETPPAFARWLLALAISSRPRRCV